MGVEPTIYCLGGSCVYVGVVVCVCERGRKKRKKKGKAPAGFEPTTFRLLGERTANYAIEPLQRWGRKCSQS